MQKSNYLTLGVIGAIVIAAGTYTYVVNQAAKTDPDNRTQSAAEVALSTGLDGTFTDLLGNRVDLRQYDGKVRVVNSWASWCPFCVTELPDFATVAAEYKDEDVVVLAINRKETPRLANQYIDTLSGVDDLIFVLDTSDSFYKAIGGFTMPETLFYDRAGNIAVHKRGFMEITEMRTHIETTLAQSGDIVE